MKRRQVLSGLGVTGFGAAIARRPQPGLAQANHSPLRPPRLSPGDRVGIFSPAGATFRQAELDIVIDVVQGL